MTHHILRRWQLEIGPVGAAAGLSRTLYCWCTGSRGPPRSPGAPVYYPPSLVRSRPIRYCVEDWIGPLTTTIRTFLPLLEATDDGDFVHARALFDHAVVRFPKRSGCDTGRAVLNRSQPPSPLHGIPDGPTCLT